MKSKQSADTIVAETPITETTAVIETPVTEAPIAKTPAETPAPTAEKRVKQKATPSSMVGNIKSACILLSQVPALNKLLEYREFNAAGSFVVRLPRFADAVEVLPVSEDSKHALQLLKATRGVMESLTGTAKQTWVLHTSGSFAVYSKMSA